jgi:hypothetical protein
VKICKVWALDPISDDLVDSTQHDIDKAEQTQPMMPTLHFDLMLVLAHHYSDPVPSSTDLVRHPIAEKEQDASKGQEQANGVECCYSIVDPRMN